MPKLEEYAEVRTTSGVYRDWTSVAVSYTTNDFEQPRRFKLSTAEPSKRHFRLIPEERVDIALAGHVVIQEGYIFSRQVGFDANRHGVMVDGFSKDGPITKVQVDVPGGELRNYDISAIAGRVLQPLGIKFRLENPPAGAMMPFPRVSVRPGETILELLTRLSKQRGLRMTSSVDGTITAGAPGSSASVYLEEGVNILSASGQITMPNAASIVGRSQAPGSDSLFGKTVSEVQATGKVQKGLPGLVQRFVSEMPLQPKELQGRVNMSLADLQLAMLRVSIVHQGWLRPGIGGLWSLGDLVRVRSPMLFPSSDGEMSLKLWSVTYTQDAQAGTTTGLDLVNEAAWNIQNPDAKAPGTFQQPTTPAQPDTPT